MIRILNRASGIALVSTLLITLLGTSGSSAAAEHAIFAPLISEPGAVIPGTIPLDTDHQPSGLVDGAIQSAPTTTVLNPPKLPAPASSATAPASLEQLVASQADANASTRELKCLAGAIYFEARSESLEGQLAVGRVIVARTRSGRFPASYCGVVYQRSQFSFIRGQSMPTIDAQSRLWQRAVALAKIADAGSWQSSAEGALFFHAARVTSGGRLTRVAQIDHHVFYR